MSLFFERVTEHLLELKKAYKNTDVFIQNKKQRVRAHVVFHGLVPIPQDLKLI